MRKALTSIVFVVALCGANAEELPCSLSTEDYVSLATSDSKLDQWGVLALSREEQNSLCTTRSFWRKVEREGTGLNEVVLHNPRYLSGEEKVRVDQAINEFMKRKIAEKGVPMN